MKLLSKNFVRDGSGSVKLVPEEPEDLWHAYNLIREGDRVTATTFRKVTRDAGTGSNSERIKVKLTIRIEGIDYDGEGAVIRLKGQNLTENEHIKLGAYHTIELEPQRAFTLDKQLWDAVDIDRIKQCTDPTASADLAVLLITEGLAHLCLVGSACTVTKAKIESSMPRKRGAAAAGYDKAIEKFYARCFTAVEKHIDWSIIKCLVIAGPGFAKDGFKAFLDAEAQRKEARPLLLNKSKILVTSASTAYTQALKEVLSAPGIANQIKDTKAAAEVAALSDFMAMLANDPSRAFYGPGHVAAAHELGAIQTLLISDSLFRTSNVPRRRRFVQLVEEVEEGGGKVLVFSGAHTSGQQLTQLTGIAAILKFPLPQLEDQEFEANTLM